jgi:hypothetical protein
MVPIEARSIRKHTFQIDPKLPSETFPKPEERHEEVSTPRVACELCDTLLADEWNVSRHNSLMEPEVSEAPKPEPQTTEYEEDYEEELLPYFTESLLSYEEEINFEQNFSELLQSFELQAKLLAAAEEAEHRVEVQPAPVPEPVLEGDQPYRNFSDSALKLIAQKLETPAATLVWLASHVNPHVRAAVARNASTPGDTVILLAKDYEAGIRHGIAENINSPMQALQLLIRDRNPLIAWRAQQTVNLLKEQEKPSEQSAARPALPSSSHPSRVKPTPMNQEPNSKPQEPISDEQRCQDHLKVKVHSPECEFAKHAHQSGQSEETVAFLQLIARKTNTPNRRLAELATNTDVRVRAAVGENANAPSEILWLLARDNESAVKVKLIDNYNCPLEILEALREDEDEFVAYQAHTALMRIIGACADNHIRTVTWP